MPLSGGVRADVRVQHDIEHGVHDVEVEKVLLALAGAHHSHPLHKVVELVWVDGPVTIKKFKNKKYFEIILKIFINMKIKNTKIVTK